CLSVHVRRPRRPPLFPYTTLFRSRCARHTWASDAAVDTRRMPLDAQPMGHPSRDRLAPPRRQPAIKTGVQTYWQRMSTSLAGSRSEEHTSELQSLAYLVCRLLLEK